MYCDLNRDKNLVCMKYNDSLFLCMLNMNQSIYLHIFVRFHLRLEVNNRQYIRHIFSNHKFYSCQCIWCIFYHRSYKNLHHMCHKHRLLCMFHMMDRIECIYYCLNKSHRCNLCKLKMNQNNLHMNRRIFGILMMNRKSVVHNY